MSFDLIRATLDARLLTLPDWPSARIAWPNLPYRPLGEETYLQVAIAASEPRQADLGSAGRNIQRGLYTVSVVAPAGIGLGASLQIADQLCAIFPRGLDLPATGFAVTILRAWAAPSFPRDSWFVTPVAITWEAFTPPN
ncbi:MAG: hypothetical protein H6826_13790 [Planctomycetes bacterium]|nr:hypothetical protein [Planctomycetota bacterium]